MTTIKQCALVTPKQPIKMGRMLAHPGQTFWVTTSGIHHDKTVGIARSGKGAGYAVMLARADFDQWFDVITGRDE